MKMFIKKRIARFKSIRHYKRMIRWVEKQDPNEKPYSGLMWTEINEQWGGHDCAYCKLYKGVSCELCALAKCCESGAWYELDKSRTWAEWIDNAHLVIKYIKQYG